jgi:hypothetical protein
MTTVFRALLGLGGAIYLLGAIWFFGGKGSYLGLAGGATMLVWSVLWTSSGTRQAICLVSLILATVAAGWIGGTQLVEDDDAAAVSISFALFLLVAAAVWIRQRIST